MKNTALHALAAMARIAMLLLVLGQFAYGAQACPSPDCAMATMGATSPCLTQAQIAPAKDLLPAFATPGQATPVVQTAAFDPSPKTIDAVAPIIRSPRRNSSLAIRHCSFQL